MEKKPQYPPCPSCGGQEFTERADQIDARSPLRWECSNCGEEFRAGPKGKWVQVVPTKKHSASVKKWIAESLDRLEAQRRVIRLYNKGLTISEIAASLKIDRNEVALRVEEGRRHTTKQALAIDRATVLADSLQQLDEIHTTAWATIEGLTNLTDGPYKLQYLDLLRRVARDRVKLAQDVGLLDKIEPPPPPANQALLDTVRGDVAKFLASAVMRSQIPPEKPPEPDPLADTAPTPDRTTNGNGRSNV